MVVWLNRWMSLSARDRSPRSQQGSVIGRWAVGATATAIATALAAPIAQAQNLTMLRCLQAANGDPYKVAQCSNPNARPPNLEEPASPPSGTPPRSQPSSNSGNSSGGQPSNRPAAQSATPQRATTNRPGIPASSYNSANRVRATLDCLNSYGTSTNQVLSECGAWGPRLNTGTTGASTTTAPAAAPGGPAPGMMPPPGSNGNGAAPGAQPIIWNR